MTSDTKPDANGWYPIEVYEALYHGTYVLLYPDRSSEPTVGGLPDGSVSGWLDILHHEFLNPKPTHFKPLGPGPVIEEESDEN
jgi:hypothetical protein